MQSTADGRTGQRGALVRPRAKEPELCLESETVATLLPYTAGKNVTGQTTSPKIAAALGNVQVMTIIAKHAFIIPNFGPF